MTAYIGFVSFALSGCTIPIIGAEVTLPDWFPFFSESSQEPITLRYWGLWEPNTVVQPIFDTYQQNVRSYVSVDYEVRDPRQHFESVRAQLSTDSPPDIIRVHATWVPFLKDLLAPMPSDFMTTETFSETFYPVVSEDLVVDDAIYGMPLGIDGLSLVYNAEILASLGLTEPPSDWDTFLEVAPRLTKTNSSGSVIVGGAGVGLAKNIDHFSDILGLMFAQSYVNFHDSSGAVNFHKSLAPDGRNLGVEALRFYAKFGTQTSKTYGTNMEASTQAFIKGNVAMVFVPSWRLGSILAAQPTFTVKVAPVPQLIGSSGDVGWATYWVEVVPQKSKHSREAWRLLQHMAEKDSLVAMYRQASAERGFGEPYPRVDLADTLLSDQYVGPYISQAPAYTSWLFADATHDILLNDRIIDVLSVAVEKAVSNSGSAGGALNDAAFETEKILKEFSPNSSP